MASFILLLKHVGLPDRACNYAPFVECLAVFIATALTVCANLSATTSGKTDQEGGDSFTKCFSAGLAVMIAVYIAGGISGAHLNPIVTFVIKFTQGRNTLSWTRCFFYVYAQLIGSYLGGLLAIGIYYRSIEHMELSSLKDDHAKAMSHKNIGPAIYLVRRELFPWWGAVLNDGFGSIVLTISILALRDENNNPPKANTRPLVAGLIVTCLSMALGYNTGGASNPFRDFGPRLAAYALIKEESIWRADYYWIWGAWVVPIIASAIGAFAYQRLIKHPDKQECEEEEKQQLIENAQTSSVDAAEEELDPAQPPVERDDLSSVDAAEAGLSEFNSEQTCTSMTDVVVGGGKGQGPQV